MSPQVGSPRGGEMPEPVAQLLAWARDELGGPISLVGEIVTKEQGFDSTVLLVELQGATLPQGWRGPLVMRIKSDPSRMDEAKREAVIQDWVADRGYPAPRVVRVFAPGELLDRPAQIMSRAPGDLVFDVIVRRPWQARGALHSLGHLHARLHELDAGEFPSAGDLLDRRLALVRRTADRVDHLDLRAALARVERLALSLRDAPGVVCHGDFHPLNVLTDGITTTVIDWTDAGVGDAAGDVARTMVLFEVAAIATASRAAKAALTAFGPALARAYRRGYSEVRTIDDARVALWRPVHLLHGWSQVVGLHAGQFGEGDAGDDRTARVPADLSHLLERRLDQSLRAVGA